MNGGNGQGEDQAYIFFAVSTLGAVRGSGFRPPFRPRARAADKPARVRSWISRCSKLCKRGEEIEDQLARSGGGIDHAIADGPKPNSSYPELLHQGYEVRHRTAQPIQSPDHQDIPCLQGGQAGY